MASALVSNSDARKPAAASLVAAADASSVIYVWNIPLSGLDLTIAWSELNRPEQERARSFSFDRDRRRFILARSALRRILGKELKLAPAKLRFELGAAGKPRLVEQPNLAFNASHSADVALVALTSTRGAVGVDIEALRTSSNLHELVDTTCSLAEADAINGSEEPNVAFLRMWTRKEAVMKALGLGIASIDLRKLDVGVDGVLVASLFGENIVVMPLDVGPGYVASFAQLGSNTPAIIRMNATDELWHDNAIPCNHG